MKRKKEPDHYFSPLITNYFIYQKYVTKIVLKLIFLFIFYVMSYARKPNVI
jgi:hypothetical protein